MGKQPEVPKEIERLLEKRDAEKDRRTSKAQRKINDRRERRRRKADR